MTRRVPIAAVLVLLAGAGCRSAGTGPAPAPPPVPAASPAVPAAGNLALRWVRNSAQFPAAAIQAYRLAARRVDEAAASRAPGTWAVSLDADETVLDNSQSAKE